MTIDVRGWPAFAVYVMGERRARRGGVARRPRPRRAPSQYAVWEDATPISGPFGTIEKRVLIGHDRSVGHLDD